MKKIAFFIGGSISRASDAALVAEDENPREALVEAAIQTISTDVLITVVGVTMHLAAWQDPEHWSDDWAAIGVEDVDALIADAVGPG